MSSSVWILVSLTLFVVGLLNPTDAVPDSMIRHFVINETASIQKAFDQMPKECTKNGKTFKEGENFEFGNLRYKCQKYGVYSIEGCQTDDKKPIALGESTVINNVKHQCLSVGNSIHYRQTVCGTMGQPDCDKIPLPSRFEEAKQKLEKEVMKTPSLKTMDVPEGWTVIDGGSNKIPNTNATVITRILMFNAIPGQHQRMKRGDNFKGPGVGSVVGVEDVGSDSGKPMMPMDMLIKLSHEVAAKKAKNDPTASRVSVTETQNQRKESAAIFSDHKQKPVAVQAVGAKMSIRQQNGGDMMKSSHSDGKQGMQYKPGTIIGSKSFVDWSGQTKTINGKPMAVGGGNFVFGNKQTH